MACETPATRTTRQSRSGSSSCSFASVSASLPDDAQLSLLRPCGSAKPDPEKFCSCAGVVCNARLARMSRPQIVPLTGRDWTRCLKLDRRWTVVPVGGDQRVPRAAIDRPSQRFLSIVGLSRCLGTVCASGSSAGPIGGTDSNEHDHDWNAAQSDLWRRLHPPIPGMRMSIRTRLGRSRSASLTRCLLQLATPIHAKPVVLSIGSRASAWKPGWSPTRTGTGVREGRSARHRQIVSGSGRM